MNKRILVLIPFVLVFLSSFSVLVYASQTFTVAPLSSQPINVELVAGDSVNGTFSVTGGTGTGIDFMVKDPNGKQLLSYNFTSSKNFSFSASTNGSYTLIFGNSFCSCEGGKTVTLNYSINEKTISGSLEGTSDRLVSIVMVITLVSLVLVIVAVVILMRQQRNNANKQSLNSLNN